MKENRAEIKRRIKKINDLQKEALYLIALDNHITKDMEKNKLDFDKQYLDNVRHRLLKIENELEIMLGIKTIKL